MKLYTVLDTIIQIHFFWIACSTTPIPSPSYLNRIRTMFSFGDSYTTLYLNTKTMSYACRNCTSAGGPNWVEYLTDAYPMIQYWDFAYNSAPVLSPLVGQTSSSVIDVATQITELLPAHFNITQYDSSETLYTIWVGINDIGLTVAWENTDNLTALIIAQYQTLVEYLVYQGARQFMLVNVPPIDRAPKWYNGPQENLVQARVDDFNKKLAAMVDDLKEKFKLPYSRFRLFDAHAAFSRMLDSPSSYGLVDVTGYCPGRSHAKDCVSSDQYFWYNDLHPTSRVHQLLAQAMDRELN
ncbi:GDSL lipase/esterase [Dichotomocladium elegans]|nr:GDSL lipase/esterase [Dichotomocladium elegans]